MSTYREIKDDVLISRRETRKKAPFLRKNSRCISSQSYDVKLKRPKVNVNGNPKRDNQAEELKPKQMYRQQSVPAMKVQDTGSKIQNRYLLKSGRKQKQIKLMKPQNSKNVPSVKIQRIYKSQPSSEFQTNSIPVKKPRKLVPKYELPVDEDNEQIILEEQADSQRNVIPLDSSETPQQVREKNSFSKQRCQSEFFKPPYMVTETSDKNSLDIRFKNSTIHRAKQSPDYRNSKEIQPYVPVDNMNIFSDQIQKIQVDAPKPTKKKVYLKKSNQKMTKSFKLLQKWSLQKKYDSNPQPKLHRGPQFVTKRIIEMPIFSQKQPLIEQQTALKTSIQIPPKQNSGDLFNTRRIDQNIISNEGQIEQNPTAYKIHHHRKLKPSKEASPQPRHPTRYRNQARKNIRSNLDQYSNVFLKVIKDKKGSTPSGRSRMMLPGARSAPKFRKNQQPTVNNYVTQANQDQEITSLSSNPLKYQSMDARIPKQEFQIKPVIANSVQNSNSKIAQQLRYKKYAKQQKPLENIQPLQRDKNSQKLINMAYEILLEAGGLSTRRKQRQPLSVSRTVAAETIAPAKNLKYLKLQNSDSQSQGRFRRKRKPSAVSSSVSKPVPANLNIDKSLNPEEETKPAQDSPMKDDTKSSSKFVWKKIQLSKEKKMEKNSKEKKNYINVSQSSKQGTDKLNKAYILPKDGDSQRQWPKKEEPKVIEEQPYILPLDDSSLGIIQDRYSEVSGATMGQNTKKEAPNLQEKPQVKTQTANGTDDYTIEFDSYELSNNTKEVKPLSKPKLSTIEESGVRMLTPVPQQIQAPKRPFNKRVQTPVRKLPNRKIENSPPPQKSQRALKPDDTFSRAESSEQKHIQMEFNNPLLTSPDKQYEEIKTNNQHILMTEEAQIHQQEALNEDIEYPETMNALLVQFDNFYTEADAFEMPAQRYTDNGQDFLQYFPPV